MYIDTYIIYQKKKMYNSKIIVLNFTISIFTRHDLNTDVHIIILICITYFIEKSQF